MAETVRHISPEFEVHLQMYGKAAAQTLASGWRSTELIYPGDAEVQYVRLGEDTANDRLRPVLHVSGFNGGIISNGPFGAALAHHGFDVTLADQSRAGLWINEAGKPDATLAQAQNLAAVVRAENLTDTPLDIVSQSYGSLITEQLLRLGQAAGWSCFEGSRLVMMAPAGVRDDETPAKFAIRYVNWLRTRDAKDAGQVTTGFGPFQTEIRQAKSDALRADIVTSGREGIEIMTRRVDFEWLRRESGIKEVVLVLFAEDQLFTERVLEKSIGKLLARDLRIRAMTAYESRRFNGIPLGGRLAGHDDHQIHPFRPASAVEKILVRT